MTPEEYLDLNAKGDDFNQITESLKDSLWTNNVIEYMQGFAAQSSLQWIPVSERLPVVDGNKQLLVWTGYEYEIARFNEWGFHYGTRNTQDTLHNVICWAEFHEPPMQ